MEIPKNTPLLSAILGIYRLLIVFFFILVVYFGQTIVIPFTVAALLTFLLAPLVVKLEKWIGRIASILVVVVIAFSFIGFSGYIFAKQLMLFGSNFQNYYEIMQSKLQDFEFSPGGIANRIAEAIDKIKIELLGTSARGNIPATAPVEVKLIDVSSHVTGFIESFFGSFFNFLGMSGIVLLLLIFMLLNREDIRGRIVKLMGQSSISSTTSAMNEASDRVFTYLFRLFIVNVIFGICVTFGLRLLGIPNAILWGSFAAIMRFVPYIGAWIAAIIPIALSFVITDTWTVPLLTILFFVTLEIITAYAVEPFYYGLGTGVSSFALIVAAILWTWFWGPIGLLLSTPLTVCLVVLGQYVPNMSFLSTLLSQEQALTPLEECYNRLLSFDLNESMDIIDSYLQKNSLVSAYDSILVPIIAQTEKDFHQESIDAKQREDVHQGIIEIVEFLGMRELKEKISIGGQKPNILCVPAQTTRDEIGILILAQLLNLESFNVHYTTKINMHEISELIDKEKPDALCIGIVAPFAHSKILFLCAKFHQQTPEMPIILCLLGFEEIGSQFLDKLTKAGVTKVVVTLSQAVNTLLELQPKTKLPT